MACWIFPDQASKQCPLHRHMDSYALNPSRKSYSCFFLALSWIVTTSLTSAFSLIGSICVNVCVGLIISDSLQPMDSSPQGSSLHGIFQARILEWVPISFSRGCCPPRDWNSFGSLSWAGGFFTTSATCLSKAQKKVWGFINWTTWIISSTRSSLTPSTHACCLSFPTPFKQVQLSLCSHWHVPLDMCFNLNISFITDESDRQECGLGSFCCCSVAQSCVTLCNPMDCSTSGLPVPHYLPEFAQVHIHWIPDAIQPYHLLMPSSPSALKLSQYQGFFQWVNCSHRWTK